MIGKSWDFIIEIRASALDSVHRDDGRGPGRLETRIQGADISQFSFWQEIRRPLEPLSLGNQPSELILGH